MNSIAIFKNSAAYHDYHIPKEIFEAVKRVIENQSCELVKIQTGVYIVKYSPTGPFPQKIGEEWLPVYIARLEQWSSGGIRKSEYEDWKCLADN